MAEKQRRVQPGFVKTGYEKPKEYTINPTLQTVVEELPVAEKAVTFREGYANSLMFDPLISFENVLEIKPVTDVQSVQKADDKFEKVKEKETKKPAISEEKDIIPEVKVQKMPSDMEIILSRTLPEVEEAKPAFDYVNTDVEVPNIVEENISNVFETINSMHTESDNKPSKNNKSDKDMLLNTKPFMKVDKVEVRSIENSSGEVVYMIGRNICSSASFEEFVQEVSGKLLALDCKTLVLHDNTYTKQNDGTYKDVNGCVKSVDDLLSILHN